MLYPILQLFEPEAPNYPELGSSIWRQVQLELEISIGCVQFAYRFYFRFETQRKHVWLSQLLGQKHQPHRYRLGSHAGTIAPQWSAGSVDLPLQRRLPARVVQRCRRVLAKAYH